MLQRIGIQRLWESRDSLSVTRAIDCPKKFQGWAKGLTPTWGIPKLEWQPSIIAVGGGKGGVGKSLFSANLAAKLGYVGYKVLLIDMDWGGANLHTYFGLAQPKLTLSDLGGKSDLADIFTATPATGVSLVAGGRGDLWCRDPEKRLVKKLWGSLSEIRRKQDVDFVILDLGAGVNRYTIDFFLGAHLGLLTVLPEPTSIENAYGFLKAALFSLMENVGQRTGQKLNVVPQIIESLLADNTMGRGRPLGYFEKLQYHAKSYPLLIDDILRALFSRSLGLVLNQTRTLKDVDLGKSMEQICSSYFGFDANFLGHLNYDEAAWKALRNRRLLLTDFPHSLLAKRIDEVTRKVIITLGQENVTSIKNRS